MDSMVPKDKKINSTLGQKKKYVCLLFDENLKQGR